MRTTSLTQARFDSMLKWLDPDRDAAATKYEAIRRRLTMIFEARGCAEAEDLADETINRVASRLGALGEYRGEPARYFYGVANKVHLEYIRRASSTRAKSEPEAVVSDEFKHRFVCLERCLEKLPAQNRDLILKYYQQEKRGNLEARKVLAEQMGIHANALRIRAQRIRVSLQNCVSKCLKQQDSLISE